MSETRKLAATARPVGGGEVLTATGGARLCLPQLDGARYANAQVDDYAEPGGFRFVWRPPCTLSLRARFSSPLHGTSGFGFWNHPFGPRGEVQAPPCNVWFFNASAESNMQVMRGASGAGFKAAALDSGGRLPARPLPARAMRAANRIADGLMRSRTVTRVMLRMAQAAVRASERVLTHDATCWHSYRIEWAPDVSEFFVDNGLVLRAPQPPRGPLGLVIWIDNYSAIAADGVFAFSTLPSPAAQLLEIEDVRINNAPLGLIWEAS